MTNTYVPLLPTATAIATLGLDTRYPPIDQDWTSGATYAVGQMVTNLGTEYRCTTAHTAGVSFDTTKFAVINARQVTATGPSLTAVETMPRIVMSAQNVAIGAVTGTVYMTAINLQSGMVINNLGFISGTTSANTPTHWWLGIADSGGVQRAHTADQLSTAVGTSTSFVVALTTPYTVPTTGVYYFLLSMTATSNCTISGHGSIPGSSQVGPVLAGVSSSGAQSTPGTDDTTTYNTPTGDNPVGYFYVT